jgi:hypothetical protein
MMTSNSNRKQLHACPKLQYVIYIIMYDDFIPFKRRIERTFFL